MSQKTSNGHLIKIYTSDVSKTIFKDVFKMDFFYFQRKILFTFIYQFLEFSSKCCFLIFGHKVVVKFAMSLLRPKTDVVTALRFQRRFSNLVTML